MVIRQNLYFTEYQVQRLGLESFMLGKSKSELIRNCLDQHFVEIDTRKITSKKPSKPIGFWKKIYSKLFFKRLKSQK